MQKLSVLNPAERSQMQDCDKVRGLAGAEACAGLEHSGRRNCITHQWHDKTVQ